jgi:hypothetical protein
MSGEGETMISAKLERSAEYGRSAEIHTVAIESRSFVGSRQIGVSGENLP